VPSNIVAPAPVTLLSTAKPPDALVNASVSPVIVFKPFQLMTALSVSKLTVVVLPGDIGSVVPFTTLGPLGVANADRGTVWKNKVK
jgi:hypothetical protein